MAGLFDRLQDEIDSQDQPGISPIDLLELPSALAKVVREIIRKNGMKLADIATTLELMKRLKKLWMHWLKRVLCAGLKSKASFGTRLVLAAKPIKNWTKVSGPLWMG